jgi:hypothetical protein
MSDWGDRIIASFVEEVREDVEGLLEPKHPFFNKCESPIERAFGAALMMVHGYFRGRPHGDTGSRLTEFAPQQFLVPQYKASRSDYRVDFLLGWSGRPLEHTAIVIECDGHAFHERTKEQAARDKSRDRDLSSEFARVLRFTGSEIYRNPCQCAVEAMGISDQVFWAWELRDE